MKTVDPTATAHLRALPEIAKRITAQVAPLVALATSYRASADVYDGAARESLADFTRLGVRVRPRHIRMWILAEVARVLEVDPRDLVAFAGTLRPGESLATAVERDVANVMNAVPIAAVANVPQRDFTPPPEAA